jgi:branched-chain amino acid transport system permease protein
LLIGLPALRIRGLFLAVTTLAFSLATSSYLLNPHYFKFLPKPSDTVHRFVLFGRIDIASETRFYYFCLVVLGLVLVSARGLHHSRTARVLIATRDNERAAQAFGISITRARLTAFSISGFFASLAGGLFVLHQQALGVDAYEPIESIRALSMVVVGGLGSMPGALLGTLFVKSTEWFNSVLPEAVRFLFTLAGSGIGLIFVLLMLRGGLGAVLYRIRDRLLRLVAKRRGLIVASLIADVAVRHPDPDAADRVVSVAPTERSRGDAALAAAHSASSDGDEA